MGRRGVNSSFKWFLSVFATRRGRGRGSAPCDHPGPWTAAAALDMYLYGPHAGTGPCTTTSLRTRTRLLFAAALDMYLYGPHAGTGPCTTTSLRTRTRLLFAAALDMYLYGSHRRYRAMYNYKPQNEDEVELAEGDIVFVMEKCDDGWFVGTSQRTGIFGTFPGNYVTQIWATKGTVSRDFLRWCRYFFYVC